MPIFKIIHSRNVPLENVEKEQIELKGDLGSINQANPKYRSEQQKKTINDIENLYNSREEVVQMLSNSSDIWGLLGQLGPG